MILIEAVEGISVKDQSVEIVERKGKGHLEIIFCFSLVRKK
jgi:S-adenosylmethionine synthetase